MSEVSLHVISDDLKAGARFETSRFETQALVFHKRHCFPGRLCFTHATASQGVQMYLTHKLPMIGCRYFPQNEESTVFKFHKLWGHGQWQVGIFVEKQGKRLIGFCIHQ